MGLRERKNPYGLERLPLASFPACPSSGSENGPDAVSADPGTGDFGTAYGIPAGYAVPDQIFAAPERKTTACRPIRPVKNVGVYSRRQKQDVVRCGNFLHPKCPGNDKDFAVKSGQSRYPGNHDAGSFAFHFVPKRKFGKEEPFAYDIYEPEFLPEKLSGSSYRRSLTSVFPRFPDAMGRHHAEEIEKHYRNAFGSDSSVEKSSRKPIGTVRSRNGYREQVDNIPCHAEWTRKRFLKQ